MQPRPVNDTTLLLHETLSRRREKQEQPIMTLRYVGPGKRPTGYTSSGFGQESADGSVELVIRQQPSGGAAVIVYRGRVRAGEAVSFVSRRNAQHPLGLLVCLLLLLMLTIFKV